jgi:cell division ATPase FtsA
MGKVYQFKEERDMAVAEKIKELYKHESYNSLASSVNELRNLGLDAKKDNPNAFTEESIEEIIKLTRLVIKDL